MEKVSGKAANTILMIFEKQKESEKQKWKQKEKTKIFKFKLTKSRSAAGKFLKLYVLKPFCNVNKKKKERVYWFCLFLHNCFKRLFILFQGRLL
jgi:hypothetical protein